MLYYYCFRSRDSDGPQTRGSRERDYHRSDERDDRRGDDRRGDEKDARGSDDKGGDRNGEYNGPPGMQPDGLIEVMSAGRHTFVIL